MGQVIEWREKAAFYWNLSKTVNDCDLCEQYAELAARYLNLAERLEDETARGALASAGAEGPRSCVVIPSAAEIFITSA
jgi:hypothetical protein